MGANHFSQTVFGVDPEQTRELLIRWLRAKGYELQENAPLTELDSAYERGIQLAWRDNCTVILYSHLEEQPRLLFELRKLGGAVLDYWMHDSDIWGYQLWQKGKCVDAFHSNPRYFGTYEDIEGPRDVVALCDVVGVPEQVERLTKLQRKKAIPFAERLSSRFVKALGVGPAASQYGATGLAWPGADFSSEQLWFRKVAYDPMKQFDLSELKFEVFDPSTAWRDHFSEAQWTEMQGEIAATKRWAIAFSWLMWPFQLLYRPWFWFQSRRLMKAARAMAESGDVAMPDLSSYETAFEVVDGQLVSELHQCSMSLPDGATVQESDRLRFLPSTVFGFSVGEHRVLCTAATPSTVKLQTRFRMPECTFEELRFESDNRLVRWVELCWEAPLQEAASEKVWQLMVFVNGPRAVYQFRTTCQAPVDPALRAACRAAIDSLRFRDR